MLKYSLLAGVALAGFLGGEAAAQETSLAVPGGRVVTPSSSVARPEDAGQRAHTNVHVFYPEGAPNVERTPYGPFETPGSLACVYGFVAKTTGCNPATATALPTGGSKVVAIVDAYDDPKARHDLEIFTTYFGLAPVTDDNFQIVYAGGTRPPQDPTGGWELEEALDIEMAHSFAPGAKIILVEAQSNSFADLIAAEDKATKLVQKAGGGEVSNSWGALEFSGEDAYESSFAGRHVVYLASTGDDYFTQWPSVLQNVVAVGGTSISRSPNYNFINQAAWYATGVGVNTMQIPIPSYQSAVPQVAAIAGAYRTVPDVSFVAANQQTYGVWMYDSFPLNGGEVGVPRWTIVAGTSVAAPSMAAVINRAGKFADSSADELKTIYDNYRRKADWTDIDIYICGYYQTYSTLKGYDLCTGVGVPNGYAGK